MNLATFRLRIGGAIGMQTQASGNERDLVDGWINEGIVDFLRKTKLTEKTAKLAVVAGTGDYTLDTDILAMKALWYEPSGNQSVLLEAAPDADIVRWRLSQTVVASTNPWCYALGGANIIKLYPTPASSSDFLHISYIPRPRSVLANTGDDPSTAGYGEIPKEFHPVLESYAKWKAGDYVDDASSQNGLQYKQEYEVGCIEAMRSTTLKAGVGLAGATWGRRRRRVISAPDVDDGS